MLIKKKHNNCSSKPWINREELFYTVYGMMVQDQSIRYFLFTESESYYPFLYEASDFDIIDPRLSKYWKYYAYQLSDPLRYYNLWVYSEWGTDQEHYDKIVDCYDEEVEIFEKYKYLMDMEFPNPSIELSAEALDDEWLLCKDCIDAWQSTTDDGIVICPKCYKMMLNPRHTSILNIS